jgi:hypothetical protein
LIERQIQSMLSDREDHNQIGAFGDTGAGTRKPVGTGIPRSGSGDNALEQSHRRRFGMMTSKSVRESGCPDVTMPVVESRFLSAEVELQSELFAMDSCHSIWTFDPARGRYRRVLKGLELGRGPVMTDWRRYYRLDLDWESGFFAVWLNAEGTQQLRSWQHTEHCEQCEQHTTAEISLSDIRSAAHGSSLPTRAAWQLSARPKRSRHTGRLLVP